ncbi:MAG: TonB-dependent receptor [Thermodesulfovibrionia bacterium]|nr:TonB-dependent receptor [Thermodesulfovibrionia bacterium]
MKRIIILMFMMLVTAAPLLAADKAIKVGEVVVTATKIEEAIEETTSDVIVIKSEDIKKMNTQFVSDVLKGISELNVVQNGGAGKQAAIVLRGGNTEHTLVMIDGVKVKSTTTGTFDFSSLNVDDIERIEIVKGPQSTIYGSEAMAGVINIITRKGKGTPKISASFETGSYGTYKPSATVSGGYMGLGYRLTGTYFTTDGISAAKKGTEKDGYKNASVSGKLNFSPTDKADIEVSGKYYYDRSDLDAFGSDDLNYVQHGNHHMLSGKGRLYLFDIWEQVLSLSTVEDSLKYKDPDTSWNNADIITGMKTIDWQNNFYISDAYTFTFGAEYRKEAGENKGIFDETVDNKALYLNNKAKLFNDDLVINAGLRIDDHETFGDETTYRIGGIYNIRQAALTVKASYGTGFRAPTLNELFYNDPWGSSGNLNLSPEKSSSWEIGLEKEIIKDRASATVTYFDQKYDDLIDWVETPPGSWLYSPKNISKAAVKGLEAGVSVKVIEDVTVRSSYTYLDTEDKETGERLRRRPKDKAGISVEYSGGPVALFAEYTFVGKVYDSASVGHLGSYSIVNLSGSYKLRKDTSFFARVDNLFDEDYSTAGGYSTPGLSAYAGIKFEM